MVDWCVDVRCVIAINANKAVASIITDNLRRFKAINTRYF